MSNNNEPAIRASPRINFVGSLCRKLCRIVAEKRRVSTKFTTKAADKESKMGVLGQAPDSASSSSACRHFAVNLGRVTMFILALSWCAASEHVNAQGCVQSRGAGTCMLLLGEDFYLQPGQWQAAIGYRWLYSDSPFIGGREQKQTEAAHTQAINDSHFIDLTASYGLTKRLSLNLTIPFVSSTRSSFTDHSDGARHTMSASGLGDLRLTSTIWLLPPEKHHEGNLALGVGVKAPTGDSKATDLSYHLDEFGNSSPSLTFVDQSIQPGDGGWGVVLEAQAFQKLFSRTYAYMNASYLINPQEK